MADKDLMKMLLEQGIDVWNEWRLRHLFDFRIDLTETKFEGLNLAGVLLLSADLRWTNLRNTNLKGATLADADLSFSDLSGANLEGANLDGANLTDTNFSGANLRDTTLDFAKFMESNLAEADLGHSQLAFTVFADVDLSRTKGLDSVRHEMPSTIGLDTIYRSKGNIPQAFLRDAGVPEDFIAYMNSPAWSGSRYHSCFISHSSKDAEFAALLQRDLRSSGIGCWYFPEDAKWGKKVWGEIDSSIKSYDKLVVICSSNSLQSSPVLREVERALQREDSEKRDMLFPIRIDNYLFEKWDNPRKADILDRVVGDFTQWRNQAAYQEALGKLVAALNKSSELSQHA